MALNFPSPASSGDTYTGSNGVVYIYDGIKWIGSGSATNDLVNHLHHGNMDFTLNLDGSVTLPLLLPRSFTAVLDTQHFYPQPGIGLTDQPWQFEVQFQVNPDGTVQTMIDQIFPQLSNPGYVSGHSFRFIEADHGIPDYNFDITLNDVVLPGGAGWTANVAVSVPPVYPSSFNTAGAIKLTSSVNSLIFGTDGKLRLPPGGDILDSSGLTVLSNGLVTTDQLVNGLYDVTLDGNGNTTFPTQGYIRQSNGYTRTFNGTNISGAPTVIWTGTNDNITSVKMTIQIEGYEGGDTSGWHTQVCEAIIADRWYGNTGAIDPQMTVYGVVHTSVDPLATFTVQRNPTTHFIEVVATPTGTAFGTLYPKVHSVELGTRD